jgi:hypothetical protein
VIVQLLLYATFKAFDRRLARDTTVQSMPAWPYVVLIVVTLVQAGFGTQVRGTIDDALDAGVARDAALATVGWLDSVHRDLAFVVVIVATVITLWMMMRRAAAVGWAYAVLALAVTQVALGALMAYGSLVPAAQVGHLTIASLLLGAETVLWLKRQT